MKEYKVKDLMVPLAEYATVNEDATLYEAVLALEKAQQEFDSTRYRHRAILVLDRSGNVVGKLGQLDVLQALEPKYKELQGGGSAERYGFSKAFMRSLMKDYHLWESPLNDICRKACLIRVADCMRRPTEGEFVAEDAALDEAIHQLVVGNHQSLLVTRGDRIVGIIRLTDVFAAIFHLMKECAIDTNDCST